MKLEKSNLWTSGSDWKIVTGNASITKKGDVVMGRGAAYEMKTQFPHLPNYFGSKIKLLPERKYGLILEPLYKHGLFQVKMDWDEKAELELIRFSTSVMMRWLRYPRGTVSLNFPGIGNGQLLPQREEILKILSVLPDEITIHERSFE